MDTALRHPMTVMGVSLAFLSTFISIILWTLSSYGSREFRIAWPVSTLRVTDTLPPVRSQVFCQGPSDSPSR